MPGENHGRMIVPRSPPCLLERKLWYVAILRLVDQNRGIIESDCFAGTGTE